MSNGDEGKRKTIHSASESLRQLLKHRMAEKAAEMKARSDNEKDKCDMNGLEETKVGGTIDEATRQSIAPLISQVIFLYIIYDGLFLHQIAFNHRSNMPFRAKFQC